MSDTDGIVRVLDEDSSSDFELGQMHLPALSYEPSVNAQTLIMKSDPKCLAFVAAIENGDISKAFRILRQDTKNRLIRPVGVLEVTALQVAAWQGKIGLVNQLIHKGADVNGCDKIGRTALYYAAHCGHVAVTKRLLDCKAKINTHVELPSCSGDMHLESTSIGKKLPYPECSGRSPLHQAVQNNHADVVRILVQHRACVDIMDERSTTPLLLAGTKMYSRQTDPTTYVKNFFEIVKILVSARADINISNEKSGTTVLHHATMLGSVETIQLLLEKGARMYQCKMSGSTPFHIAAKAGNSSALLALLNTTQSYLIDTRDHMNCTALHIAAFHGHRECVKILINYGANLAAAIEKGITAANDIFNHIPQPVEFLTDIFDSYVYMNTFSEKYSRVDREIKVDFKILTPDPFQKHQMDVIIAIINAASSSIHESQLTILQHPLVETFIRLKWKTLRIFFFFLMLIHLFFVVSLSFFALNFIDNNTNVVWIRKILYVCLICLLIQDFIQLLLEPKPLKQVGTLLSIVCVLTLSFATALGSELANCDKEEREKRQCAQWILHCLSIVILFSWMQTMELFGRFFMKGYYAQMFFAVLINMLKIILIFGFLIVGFALSFMIVFHGKDQFATFWKAIVSTVVMMIGEYEYTDLFNNTSTDNKKSEDGGLLITGRIIFFMFVIITTIVLINLMTGLAISDIQALKRKGYLYQLVKQAEVSARLEKLTSHKIFRNKWIHPRLRLLTKLKRDISRIYILSSNLNSFQLVYSNVPMHLREALYLLAIKTLRKSSEKCL